MLGIVDEKEFNKSLDDAKNAPSIVNGKKQKQVGDDPCGLSVKKVLIEEALTGSNKTTAQTFGVSKSLVDHLKLGKNGDDPFNAELKDFLRTKKNQLAETAMSRLGAAMESITDEKLEAASLRESSAVAKDMASVVRDMTARDESDNGITNNVQFVLHAPDIKKIEDYEVISLNE